jgi:pyridoxine 4-dehydrogenase
MELVKVINKWAKEKGWPTAQLALSWIRAHGVVPIPGASSQERVKENCADLNLTKEDLADVNAILERFSIAGDRYPPGGMKHVEY